MKYEPIIADTYYHIYNRGNNSENIFIEERNYNYFLKLMDKYLSDTCTIYAYCLLKNHFHLILKTKNNIEAKTISLKFSHFFNSYAQAINKAFNRTGSLFTTRFKRKKIDDEEYLKNLIIYTHLNPEHHQLTSDFRKYKYSSYASYLSHLPTKLDREFILELFGDRTNFEYIHLQKKERLELESEYSLE